jgi:CspA family cold shock protein
MSRGKDFRDRGERRRGFDDDNFSPSRDFGGGGGYAPMPRQFGGPSRAPAPASGPPVDAVVKWFNPEKGFGFVSVGDGGKDVFVHASVLQQAGMRDLAEGQRVSMRVVEGMKGREAASISAS